MWGLLIAAGWAATPGTCGTADVLEALRGAIPAPYPYALTPPPRLGVPSGAPPPAGEKTVYGGYYDHHYETENFTINWWDDRVTEDMAVQAGEALENAWQVFVTDGGWTAPVSSDTYYVWVLLDYSLGSTTGYTNEYNTDLYPDGYPVIWLNPASYTDYGEDFWAALAAHEFMHTLQYALRDWDGTYEGESWYWEASATWACELAAPEVDGHQYTSAWYAEQPELRYDSLVGSHQYGIFVLNAWMEEVVTGPDGMRAVWEAGADRPDDGWDVLMSDTTGLDVGALWGGFTGAYGNQQLAESDLYTRVAVEGTAADGTGGTLPYLGTHYWRVTADATYAAEGDVVLSAADGVADAVAVADGDVLAVTALDDDVTYTLRVVSPDTGGADTGGADSGGADSGVGQDTAGGEPGGSGSGGSEGGEDTASSKPPTGRCACGVGAAGSGGWVLALLGGVAALRRRRPA